jgi:hypothetical protein
LCWICRSIYIAPILEAPHPERQPKHAVIKKQ